MQRKGRKMLGWDSGLVDHALGRRVGPSSTRPRLKSKREDVTLEKERESGRRKERRGGGEAAAETLAEAGRPMRSAVK